MKKKKLKKLSFNKNTISDLDKIKAGVNLVEAGTRVGSGCQGCKQVSKSCYTLCQQFGCTWLYCPDPNDFG